MEVAEKLTENTFVTLASGTDRGGVIGGYSPVHSAIQLYLIQIISIVVLCFVLGLLIKKWNQPRVIAEVMAGVLLGPSALGAIPGFTDTMFPEESIEPLTLTAHLGLVLFLFIIGLELDPGLLRSNAKRATILSLSGQGFTWLLSLGVSQAMIAWLDGVDSSTSFILFIGVSLSVTAFPVLSRILTENHLLNTSVGSLVISAASVDEACVWCLLALVVSTVNAGSPLDAFYVFLLLIFFVVVMLTVVRRAMLQIVRRIGGDTKGTPARGVVILCLLLTLISAWVTDFIGIDAIFGAFVAGIIVPREHSLHVRIVELVQDVVSVLLLPLYFAVSGLKTDVTLLNNATTWGVCLLTICAACVGKIGGTAAVSGTALGMTIRESAAVGVLMNTRGLVELIILNIGLDAGVLTKEVMAIMVVMALATTFMTAPLSGIIYPIEYHTLPGSKFSRRTKLDPRDDTLCPLSTIPDLLGFAQDRLKLLMLVSNPASLDVVTRVAGLFNGSGGDGRMQRRRSVGSASPSPTSSSSRDTGLEVHALRLVEKSDRFSSDMRALERGETLNNDSLTGILQGFLGLLMIKVNSHISVGSTTDFCQDVQRLTNEHGISTVVFPWETSSTSVSTQLDRVTRLLDTTCCQTAIAINCHRSPLTSVTSRGQLRILVPFFGGKDDVAAVLLALAIVRSDSSADLMILSFVEPHKNPAATLSSTEEFANGTSAHVRNGSTSQVENSVQDGGQGGLGECKDVEAPGGAGHAALPADLPPTPPSQQAASRATQTVASQNIPTVVNNASDNPSQYLPGGWSGLELMKMMHSLERVGVTPAWSLAAELKTDVSSSPSASQFSESARLVQQLISKQPVGLVISGCTGSGHLPPSRALDPAPWHDDIEAVAAPKSGIAPVDQPDAQHEHKQPKTTSLGPLNISRRGLSYQTWHPGKSSSRHGAKKRIRSLSRSLSNAASGEHDVPWEGMTGQDGDLGPLVGDVVTVLMKSERCPAVLAVRASLTSL